MLEAHAKEGVDFQTIHAGINRRAVEALKRQKRTTNIAVSYTHLDVYKRQVQSFFYSAVTRTSGFSIYDLGDFSNASLLCMVLLRFVGAAPGSTGGGIKLTTLFVCI